MTVCMASAQLQDFLDGLLPEAERAAFESHLAGCPQCAADVVVYRRVFGELAALPLLELPAGLESRILAAVLPRRRPEWVRRVGYAYAASLIVSLAGLAAAALLPAPRALLQTLVASGLRSAVSVLMFVLHAFNATTLRLVDMMGAVDGWLAKAAPFMRVVAGSLAHPGVLWPVAGAVVACAVVLWWMRVRDGRSVGGVRHVGLLGL